MTNKLSSNTVYIMGSELMLSNDLQQLCEVVGVDENQVKFHSIYKKYKEFKVPKHHNQYRDIEAPEPDLMQLLKQFNLYLQSAYYLKQTPSAYGFIISVHHEKHPKNILENARRHLGHRYMMKMDFKDFFHQIGKQRLYKMFRNHPFEYSNSASQTLSNLFTYKDRLPMGAPTSPVLSNFACIDFDNELQAWAERRQITYTRFADDLTFSTDLDKFSNAHFNQVLEICKKYRFELNQSKTYFYDVDDAKEVTGLLLHETVDIDDAFYKELDEDLARLKSLAEAGFIVKQNYEDDVFKKYKQEVKGKINFIGMIEGYQSKIFYKYSQKLKRALTPNTELLFARWTHFNYF